MRKFFIGCFLLLSASVIAQKEVARAYVDTLCSPYFFGRGYQKDGVGKAANYLEAELKRLGVDPFFGYSYLQPFDHKANSFKGTTQFKIGRKSQKLGQDFIQEANSGSFSGSVATVQITLPKAVDEAFLKALFSAYPEGSVAFCIDHENLKACDNARMYKMLLSNAYPIIIYNTPKLTWAASTQVATYPIINSIRKKVKGGKTVFISVTQELLDYRSQNVAGLIEGTEHKDNYIIISAHYDHLGGLDEQTYIPGANDNASGTAMVLNFAKKLKEQPPKNSVIFMFFAGEELGLLGSKFFVDKKPIPLRKIKFVLNLDLLGTGDDGFAVVNGKTFPDWMDLLEQANKGLKQPFENVKLRGEAANSDHYWFSKNGVPAFFIYTQGGISAYHDIYDKAETLPLTRYNDMYQMLSQFIYSIP